MKRIPLDTNVFNSNVIYGNNKTVKIVIDAEWNDTFGTISLQIVDFEDNQKIIFFNEKLKKEAGLEKAIVR